MSATETSALLNEASKCEKASYDGYLTAAAVQAGSGEQLQVGLDLAPTERVRERDPEVKLPRLAKARRVAIVVSSVVFLVMIVIAALRRVVIGQTTGRVFGEVT